jgi:hypothetical protein
MQKRKNIGIWKERKIQRKVSKMFELIFFSKKLYAGNNPIGILNNSVGRNLAFQRWELERFLEYSIHLKFQQFSSIPKGT